MNMQLLSYDLNGVNLLLRKSYYCEKAITAKKLLLRITFTANYIYCELHILRITFTAKNCKKHLLRNTFTAKFLMRKKNVKFRISLLLYYILFQIINY